MMKMETKRKLNQNNMTVTLCTLSADELKGVQTLRVGDEDGFNRSVIQQKTHAIAAATSLPWVVFPPIFLARIGGILYDLDGQHRRLGHIEANKPALAVIVDCSIEQAKKNFALHNSTTTRVPESVLVQGQDNPVAMDLRLMTERFNCSPSEAISVVKACAGNSKRLNYHDDDARVPREALRLAKLVLSVWSTHPGWLDAERFPAFRKSGSLRLACMIASDNPGKAEPRLRALSRLNQWRGKRGWFHAHYEQSWAGVQKMADFARKQLLKVT